MEVGTGALSEHAELGADERERVEREVEGELESLGKAQGGDAAAMSPDEEAGALNYLLGARAPLPYDVKSTLETVDGPKPLTFVIRQMDGRKIDAIETRNRDKTTGVLDQISCDVQLVGEACLFIVDATGKQTDPKSEAFRTVRPEQPPLASPADALEARFREQLGILSGVAREVRRVSGWAPERVGQADRRLVDAAGN